MKPEVMKLPRPDHPIAIERTAHATYCPYKGECAYSSIPLGGERSVNVVWTYEVRMPPSRRSRTRRPAFYPNRVDTIN